ncbi:hypothetical protein [Mycobacteroides chelonae]|uniref:hypothetical protein n=1 Tax=Mycobacteroides chelonae TaxID=1774 RepID=UPI0005C5C8FF|nr:hypothetical protein [Mycobacteroides chelonae]OHT67803.1 hypothetical protein BKG66_24570 [Mycobacteroides chelonae]OHT69446.1 hypothetical protein BKG67_23105 [Mycobacteroides chelonae]
MTLNSDEGQPITKLAPDIKKAGKFVAFQWPGIMEGEDAEQAIFLHLLERPTSVDKILEMDKKAQYRAIVGIGNQLASAERADYDYFKGSYRYSVKEVKSLLQQGILTEQLKAFKSEYIDVEFGIAELAEQYRVAIVRRYAQGEAPESDAARKVAERAVDSLVDEMNKSNKRRHSERDDGAGTRNAMTIGQCQSALEFDWDGEGTEFEQ